MLRERYTFTGKLICETGLHVGSGRGSERTDATVMTDHEGKPFIPGSSLKGAMRSTVERIGQVLNHTGKFRSCLMFERDGQIRCVTCNESLSSAYEGMRERRAAEGDLVLFLLGNGTPQHPAHLCDTCKVFGSPYYASKVRLTDAYASNWQNTKSPDVRDGVGIDRDTETARENIKFDFEVVQPRTEFKFEAIVDDPDGKDLALVCLALREMESAGIRLGGIKSRGLGKCKLGLDGQVTQVTFTDAKELLDYLLSGKGKSLVARKLIDDQLKALLQ